MSKVERSQDLNQSLIDKVRSGKSPTPKDRHDRFSYRFNKSSEDAKIRIQKDILDSLKESDGIPPLVYPQDYIFDIAHFRANGNLGELIDDMSNIANPEEKFEMVKSENRILRERLHNALQREMKAIKTFQKLANDNRLLLLKLKEWENINKGKTQCGPCSVINGSVYSPALNSNGHLKRHDRITLDDVKVKPMANKSTTTCDLGENAQDKSTSTDDLPWEDVSLTQQSSHKIGNETKDLAESREPVATVSLSLQQRRELFKAKSYPDILKDFNVVKPVVQGRFRSSSLGCQGSKDEKTDAVQIHKSASISGAINSCVGVSNILPFRKLGENGVRSFPSCLDVVDEETDAREHNSHAKDRGSFTSEGNFSLTHSTSSDLESNSPCHTPSPESVFSERMSFPPHGSLRSIHMHSRSLPAQLNQRQLQANLNIEGSSNDLTSENDPKQSFLEVSKTRRKTADSISRKKSAALASGSTRSLPADISKRDDIKQKVDKALSSSDDSDKEEKPLRLRRRAGYIENDPNDFAADIRKFQKMLSTGQLPPPSHVSDNEEDIIQACEAVRNQRYSRRRGSAVVQIPASSVQMDLHVATEEPLEVRKKQFGSVLSLDDKRGSRWSYILKNRRKLLLQKDKLRISEDLKEYLSTKTRPAHIDSETELSLYRDTHWTHLMTITDETGHSRPLSDADIHGLPDKEMKRREAVWELFHSEVVYLTAHLLVLKECFLEPLREIQGKGFLTNIDERKIFTNLEDLCEVSAKFAKDLLRLFKNEQENQFGSTASVVTAFTKFKCDVHPQYEHYCLSYTSTLNYLETLKPMEDVQELFKWCETDPRCKRLKLTDLLVAPFQHLTKYPLLLKNIRKRTSEGDRQHAPLTSTIKSVEVLIQELEGNVTVVRNYQKLKELQKNLVWPSVGELDPKSYIPELIKGVVSHQECGDILASPKRQLIYEGPLTLFENAKTDVIAFLFDDMLLLTKGTKKSRRKISGVQHGGSIQESLSVGSPALSRKAFDYNYSVWKQPLPIDRFVLHDLDEYQGNSIRNGFVLVHMSRFKQAIAIHTLQASSKDVKDTWISKLKATQSKWNEMIQQEDSQEKNQDDFPTKHHEKCNEDEKTDSDSEHESATNSESNSGSLDEDDIEVQTNTATTYSSSDTNNNVNLLSSNTNSRQTTGKRKTSRIVSAI